MSVPFVSIHAVWKAEIHAADITFVLFRRIAPVCLRQLPAYSLVPSKTLNKREFHITMITRILRICVDRVSVLFQALLRSRGVRALVTVVAFSFVLDFDVLSEHCLAACHKRALVARNRLGRLLLTVSMGNYRLSGLRIQRPVLPGRMLLKGVSRHA